MSINNNQTSSTITAPHDNSTNCNPHPQPKKQKRKILSEEEYTTTLSTIIQRDYYPSIPSLHRDVSVLQKRSENDTAGAIAIRRAARRLELQEEECKLREEKEDCDAFLFHGGIRDKARPLERESIDGFHKRVTSEDNAYFDENMRKEVKEKRERMDIIYQSNVGNPKGHVFKLLKNYDEHSTGRECQELASSTLTLLDKNDDEYESSASDQFNAPVKRIQVAGATEDGKSKSNRNSLFFTPQHYNPSMSTNSNHDNFDDYQPIVPLLENRNIPANETSKSDHQIIMPPPPRRGNIQLITHNNQKDQPSSSNPKLYLVEYQAKPNPISTSEKQIIPQNTRFEYQSKSRIIPSSSTSRTTLPTSSINSSIQQNTKVYDTDSSYTSTDLDAPLRPLHVERKHRLNQLEKERNTFVAMTPTIIPGVNINHHRKIGDINDRNGFDNDDNDVEHDNGSPIITWGQIASTPLVVSGEILNQYTAHDTNDFNDIIHNNSNDEINHYDDKNFHLPTIGISERNAMKAEEIITRQKQRFNEATGNGSAYSRNNNTKKIKATSNNNDKNVSSLSSSLIARKQSLTPAARSLLRKSFPRSSNSSIVSSSASKLSDKVNARCNSALGSALRSSYTPKRIKIESGSRSAGGISSISKGRSRDPSSIYKLTPLSSRKQQGDDILTQKNFNMKDHDGSTNGNSDSLTSGLLNF